MKLRLSSILITISILFFSCTKESIPVDPRDAFEGYYKGDFNITIPSLAINETETIDFYIEKGSSSNTILIELINGEKATVSGSSFVYDQFSITENNPTGTVVFILNGTGTLTGTRLTQSGTIKTVIQGTTYSGTWSSSSVKQ